MAAVISLALSGCATTLDSLGLDNRLSMSLAQDALYVNSMYGPLGITSKISNKDLEAIKAMKAQSAASAVKVP